MSCLITLINIDDITSQAFKALFANIISAIINSFVHIITLGKAILINTSLISFTIKNRC